MIRNLLIFYLFLMSVQLITSESFSDLYNCISKWKSQAFNNSQNATYPWNCQLRRQEVQIVGGVESLKHEFPWMVGIQISSVDGSSYSCGGSIVSASWIVTAAHCIHNLDLSSYSVIAGDHNTTYFEGKEQIRNVGKMVHHPQYNPMYENDIAVMRIFPPFDLNGYVQPVPLPSSNFLATQMPTAVGWGRLSDNGPISEVLMKVDLPFVSDEVCRASYGSSRIKDTMMCAGTGGRDACQGDSGGGLLCKYGKNWFLCGITSFGNGCAKPNFPGVFTEVTFYAEWINAVIKPSM